MLYGENFSAEPHSPRTDDARKRREFEEEFKRGYDPQRNRMLSPAEIERRDRVNASVDYWFNKYKQEQADEAAEQARRIATQKAREADAKMREDAERRQQERQQRRAQWEFNEGLIDREIADLTADEKRLLGEKLGQRITDIDAVTIGAEEIRLRRKQ